MNNIERLIYNLVKKNPKLKNLIVDLYQRMTYLFPIRNDYNGYSVIVREGFFFGFHDKCPWSSDNQHLLAHRFGDSPLRMPMLNEPIEVGYFLGENFTTFHAIGTTTAWNWQMGAMLQWIGNSGRVIFNDFDGTRNIARIIDTRSNDKEKVSCPVAAVSPSGEFGLSHSFERLRIGSPGYEYPGGFNEEESDPVPKKDGLFLVDLKSYQVQKLFSIEQIAKMGWNSDMENAYHFFSHCQFSPSTERFIFYHRWLKSNGVLRSRMIACDVDGKNIFIFPTAGMVSHMCWRDDKHVLAFANTEKYGDKYYLFTDKSETFEIFGLDKFKSDGHPQFSSDTRFLLTDKYPDRFRRQSLLLYDTVSQELRILLQLRIPLEYRYSVRCDFHPRWNRDSSMICFDSAHTGKRALCTLKSEDAV